ncbi:MAG: HU family DNA-binding protein [Anaerolineae bacterium]|nr:HU family DNA-binding protein [Anaerolineae bacterium]
MTLTKKTMIREIGRRTRLKYRDVQLMLEALIEVWTEELAEGSGRIELEGLFVLESRQHATIFPRGQTSIQTPRITMRLSRTLRRRLKARSSITNEQVSKP